MDITVVGDTHGCHRLLDIKLGRILIHTGDITAYGLEHEVLDFLDWINWQPFKHKIFIGGSHDLYLKNNKELVQALIPEGVVYLENNSVVIDGLKIYGTPASLFQRGMAFSYQPGYDIERIWSIIPEDADILVSHMPPRGILDNKMGCPQLLEKVDGIRPKLHLFGHVHEGYGIYEGGGTVYCNAAVIDSPDLKNNPARGNIREVINLTI